MDQAARFHDRTDSDVRNAIFIIETPRQVATAFPVGDGRHFVTASHVVDGANQLRGGMRITNPASGDSYDADLIRAHPSMDVALLRLVKPITIQGVKAFRLSLRPLEPGISFSTYGYPIEYGGNWFYGVIGNEEADGRYSISFSITFDPAVYGGGLEGLSGAPVFDMRDRSTVLAIMSEHGPVNYQTGRVVSAAKIAESFRALVTGDVVNLAPGSPAAHTDWANAPVIDRFFGRSRELSILRRWVLTNRMKLIAIVGMGGAGKSWLSARLSRGGIGKSGLGFKLAKEVQDHFTFVIWRSLLNAPKLPICCQISSRFYQVRRKPQYHRMWSIK
jgi:hypothetical protein